ncbi:hypothetical protein C8Q72DRAFT_881664 [Fomitopsis betulina]|nr:hypothetical protein C8Q72DRAFT_881664 [Fomitopsis betulina]
MQASSSAQIRTSPRKAARSSTVKPLAPKPNVLPSPSESASSRKRPRLAPPEPQYTSQIEILNLSQVTDPYEVIPSSQSDEQELTMSKVTKKDPTAVKEAVDLWRREAGTDVRLEEPVDFPGAEFAMDVDGPEESLGSPLSSIPTGLQTPRSEAEMRLPSPPPLTSPASCHTAVGGPVPVVASSTSTPLTPISLLSMSERSATPPEALAPPVPPTIVAPDQDSRTAQIIADIKARAYATALSSPESVSVELKELGYHDSSSDESEEDFMVALNKFDKGRGKARPSPTPVAKKVTRSATSTSNISLQDKAGSSRYSLRRKEPDAGRANNRRMPILVCASSARSKRETDPLEALLKEKRRVDKRGGGEDALCAAEAAISSSSKEKKAWAKANLMREMEEEDSSDVDPAWMDEHAAMDVVKKSARRFKSRSSTPGLNFDEDSDDESDGELEEERQQALKELGQEGAQKVGHILSGNRLLREAMSKVKLRDRVLGVPLWDDSPNADGDDAMEVDCLPVLSFGEAAIQAHPLLGMLQDATLQEDMLRLGMLLHSGVLSTLQPAHAAMLVPWLYAIVADPVDRPYTELAYHSLLSLARFVPTSQSCLSANLLAATLLRLGAKSGACSELSQVPPSKRASDVDSERRERTLYRILSIFTAFGRERTLRPDDVPSILLLLVLIALDRNTLPELERDAIVAIEAVSRSIPISDAGVTIEATVCTRLVEFAKKQAPMNQALMLSFISGGGTQTGRIARNIAHALLLEEITYTPFPPLEPIVHLLSPTAGSSGVFDIQSNTGKADYYEDLCCYVDILSKALSDISGYTALEKEAATRIPPPTQGEESPKKSAAGEREPTQLEQIKALLDSLHGKIVDTRAAFLDRSRAKAAIQRLSLRVHYQRVANLRSGPGTGKPRPNLRNYFAQNKAGA